MTDYISRHKDAAAQDMAVEYEQLRRDMRRWRAEHGWVMRPLYRGYCRATIRRIRAAKWALASWGAVQ